MFPTEGRPYSYSSVSFSNINIFFLTRFLQKAWRTFHEIFSDGAYIPRMVEKKSQVMTSLPVRDIDLRYLFQILTIDRQKAKDCTF